MYVLFSGWSAAEKLGVGVSGQFPNRLKSSDSNFLFIFTFFSTEFQAGAGPTKASLGETAQ